MELIKNIKENEFDEMVGLVYFKYFDKYINLRFDIDVPMEYVQKTAEKLNKLDDALMNEICRYSLAYYKDRIESYPDIIGDIKIKESDIHVASDIIKHMSFDELVVNLPEDMSYIGINLGGSCDWDEENGIQWLIKDDTVVYVGPWDDLDIWYSPYEEDDICNYVVIENE